LENVTKKEKKEIDVIINEITNKYLKKDIFPYIAYIEKNTENISDLLNEVNQKVQKSKMQRPLSFDYLDAKSEDIKNIDIFKEKNINGQIPKTDKNEALEFNDIAKLSKGDSKLAALKLDVDNLGSLFCDRTEDEYKTLSKALTDFFDEKLVQLIKELKMQQNIYVVFSGGDDCFLIGSWDKVLKLAIELRRKFAGFQRDLKEKIISLPKDDITFSAGIIVFQPHFPMLQLAEEVEEALGTSKRADKKSSVTIFGKCLTWDEFEKAQKLSATLEELINNPDERKKENKRLLQIFRSVYPQNNEMPKVWRLKYYLRRNVKKDNEVTVKQMFDDFTHTLLFRYLNDKTKNPDPYLVASRWAELLLKN
jgi:CRISPR-associated protein Csm1